MDLLAMLNGSTCGYTSWSCVWSQDRLYGPNHYKSESWYLCIRNELDQICRLKWQSVSTIRIGRLLTMIETLSIGRNAEAGGHFPTKSQQREGNSELIKKDTYSIQSDGSSSGRLN